MVVASEGGHWVQLLRLNRMFNNFKEVDYCSTFETFPPEKLNSGSRYHHVPDCNRDNLFKVFITIVKSIFLLLKIRPDVVISTGALPGLIIIILAKVFIGSKTIWIDSIANGEKISMSGRHARKFSDIWLTQWKDLADSEINLKYLGSVI